MSTQLRLPRAGARTALACFLATLASPVPVINATFGLFLLPIARDLHWPRSRVSLVLVMVALASAGALPVAGRLADRFGARRVALAGTILFPCGVASLWLLGSPSVATPLATASLFLLLGASASLPSAMLYARLLSGWFSGRRGLVLGLVGGGGNGLGCVLMPALAALAIAAQGWRIAYPLLGLVSLAIGLPAMALLARDPKGGAIATDVVTQAQVRQTGMGRAEAIRTRSFWLVLLLQGLGAGSLTAVFTHVVPILADRGLSPILATTAVSTVALSGSAWQPVIGYMLDRTGDPRRLAPFFLLAALGLVMLSTGRDPAVILAGAILVGMALGTDYGAVPLLAGRYFGLRAFGAISGLIYGINAVVLGIAPFLLDLCFDRTGSYRTALVAVALCLASCAACCVLMPRFRTGRPAVRQDSEAPHRAA